MVDPRTPVIIGVGEVSERIDDADYKARSAADLGGAAAAAAVADTGASEAITARIDVVAGVRQFEISSPLGWTALGRSSNYPRAVANRIGAKPTRAVLEVSGGQGPQHLVNEFSAAIAAGDAEAVLLVGSEAISTDRHLAMSPDRPDFSEEIDGDLEDRGFGIAGLVTRYMLDHNLLEPVMHYALLDNARRARLGLTREQHVAEMGRLFAPFTEVAAANPHSASPVVRTAAELATPSEANRPIADPYTRYLVSRDQVNQGAAVLLTSVGAARHAGVDESRFVYLHGHADLREKGLLERPDLDRSPAAIAAIQHALGLAGKTFADLDVIDLYSCFPIAVAVICDAFGLDADDPRRLTVTGGLPFFGGSGNNYSMHAIAELVQRLRDKPASVGLVGANGGMLSKYSVGVYSTTPAEWVEDASVDVQAELDAVSTVPVSRHADGWATIESYTVTHGRKGKRDAVVIARLERDGSRLLARMEDGDSDLITFLGDEPEPIGKRIYVRSSGQGNRATLTDVRMRALHPRRKPALRDSYEFVNVHRDGHLLEITINRADARNSLHPPANAELEEIFDAYFADPELWVAILTGAGTTAFCAGNDLMYTATGQPLWFPKTGFGGLTSRANMTKPVIAAVNGFAMGGGLELALASHVVVADSAARFALSEVRVGLVAAMGGLVRLPRAVPRQVANEMVLTGRQLNAQEALAFGLVSRVVDEGTALDGARALASEILEASPTSVRLSLQIMAEADGIADPVEAANYPSTALDELIASQDTYEGLSAFAEKRKPVWRNR